MEREPTSHSVKCRKCLSPFLRSVVHFLAHSRKSPRLNRHFTIVHRLLPPPTHFLPQNGAHQLTHWHNKIILEDTVWKGVKNAESDVAFSLSLILSSTTNSYSTYYIFCVDFPSSTLHPVPAALLLHINSIVLYISSADVILPIVSFV